MAKARLDSRLCEGVSSLRCFVFLFGRFPFGKGLVKEMDEWPWTSARRRSVSPKAHPTESGVQTG
jgi:hypothetical protein